ncbi:glycine/D-amino acid oxidase, deaminating [Sanguibacter keddieii DSM 10542]|uniref:Glycine/D-amino acid oxidase, deaminating n=1 Tax=Sanguibacter keddieii (strain ATCC 51767 / DSM 10542 / NCFB 3025 / ST-74) TaxID=446469 RepID=D1BER1_SANKS|nr:FAD-dependent oxidoreductase [Sanguibacter keddieii]ACZ23347.1 glycine/D-amino acid oxidase, deaminating [Sanguibacter keddieii DSM 10542]
MTETAETVETVVVGGGVMGSAAAWALASAGREVLLLERFEPGHVRGASHGASRIYRTTYAEPEYLDLAQEALGHWRALEAEAGVELLTLTGGVSGGAGDARREEIAAAFVARGVPHEWLSAEAAAERWPGLRFDGRVLHETETAGRVHADRAVEAFQAVARARGAQVRHSTAVLGLETAPGGVRVLTDSGEVIAQRVVVAVGAWSAGLVAPLLGGSVPDGASGTPLPLVVTQEQPAHFALRVGAPDELSWPSFTNDPGPALVGPGRRWPSGTYGLATPGEGIKVGFHGVGPRTDPDHRSFQPEQAQLDQLLDYVAEWVPGVDPSTAVPISCTYTTTPDHDFVLDRVGRVTVAAGFSGHGFKFAPSLGRVLRDLATEDVDGPVGVVAERFRLARLTRPTT